jgi:cytochrome c oxidase assembly factor 3
MSPGLKRAREPYRVRNAITGLTLAALGIGVWAYSISAVKQDVFDDVDEEARALAASSSMPGNLKSQENEQKGKR